MKLSITLACACLCSGQALVIRNATVIDGSGAPAQRATVVIAGAKIAGVGQAARIPPGAKIIDATGKYLIPGLWDMHVHLWESDPMLGLYLANGITGVRDMGSDLARTGKLRDEVAARKRDGPQIVTSGAPIDLRGSSSGKLPIMAAATPEQARSAVDKLDDDGADFIEVLSGLGKDQFESVAQRARIRRISFAGHVPDEVPIDTALDLRQKSIEHLDGVLLGCSPLETSLRQQLLHAKVKKDWAEVRRVRKRARETFRDSQASILLRKMAVLDVAQCPTLSMLRRSARLGDVDNGSEGVKRYVPAPVLQGWGQNAPPDRISAELKQDLQAEYELQSRLVGRMANSGVLLLAGTDTGDDWVLPGFSLHDELAYMVEAGLTPMQALQSATRNPAVYFGNESAQGTIARGKAADLVLLNADPLADIRNTRKVEMIIRDGKLYSRKQLDALLKAAR